MWTVDRTSANCSVRARAETVHCFWLYETQFAATCARTGAWYVDRSICVACSPKPPPSGPSSSRSRCIASRGRWCAERSNVGVAASRNGVRDCTCDKNSSFSKRKMVVYTTSTGGLPLRASLGVRKRPVRRCTRDRPITHPLVTFDPMNLDGYRLCPIATESFETLPATCSVRPLAIRSREIRTVGYSSNTGNRPRCARTAAPRSGDIGRWGISSIGGKVSNRNKASAMALATLNAVRPLSFGPLSVSFGAPAGRPRLHRSVGTADRLRDHGDGITRLFDHNYVWTITPVTRR